MAYLLAGDHLFHLSLRSRRTEQLLTQLYQLGAKSEQNPRGYPGGLHYVAGVVSGRAEVETYAKAGDPVTPAMLPSTGFPLSQG